MRVRKLSVSALALLSLVACAVGPDFNRPDLFEDKELARTLDLKPTQEVTLPFKPQDFKDKVLDKLLHEAMEKAPDIRTARARVLAARAMRLGTTAGLFPTFDLSGQYTHQKVGDNMINLSPENIYQAGLSISWELELFGKKRRSIEAAEAEEQQTILALENVMISVVSEVGSAYIGLRTTQHLLDQTKADLKIQQELARLTHDKYKSGLSSAIDVNQADYQVATTRANIPKLETEIETYQNTLAVLLGEPAGSFQKRLKFATPNLVTEPFHFSMDKLRALPVEVVRSRPDVMGAEMALKAQNARVGEAIATLFPSLSLSAFFGLESLHGGSLFEKKSYGHSYTPSLLAPLFHFGALWQNMKAAEANLSVSMIAYEKTLLNATKEIRDVLVGLQKMEARHKDLVEAWHKMDKAAELARNRYASGLIDYFQVLDAEERRIAAQAAVTTSCGSLYQNILNFYKAVGGQFTFDQIQKDKRSSQ